ncbi:putative peptidyl-prolyl cis-trans isomerase-like 3 protein [Botrytis fragariae]|uniref:Peptidyl-prolyl cis-trans isomerase n=1 Tax=Botrytis fragariae TaxID=1964551 RepID=A0A8H6EEL8_9HELO|nr:putative peptidyl-prolyl cis-trans isomerase-like 3 protein [Botrytis fragariae]KAF5869070.1 putative peptidyl-prolyl cis-trans isomerase-like 3 protein [Botrytis fragariae]
MSVTLHTSLGNIKIEVFCDSVPKTAENFLALCASHYYDSSPFHRLIPTFMIQTGAPSPTNPLLPSPPPQKAAPPSGTSPSPTKSVLPCATTRAVSYPWPTKVPKQTAPSFSSSLLPRRISMGRIPCLDM